MKSQKNSRPDPDAATVEKPKTLQTMSDLYSLDLSDCLQRMRTAGLLTPERDGDEIIYRIPVCPEHLLVNLPVCLVCDELARQG
ncbi:MAG: hypothetical protein JMDDDDMK_00738 [Acidobacteria bacterium]|nr:hypothetical protein [Acidobacteriota bacterium]